MRKELTQQEKANFEPMAKVLAANGIAQSLSFSTERKYLEGISSNSMPMSLELASARRDLPQEPMWIKISQVGKPLDNSAEKCFTAIQKILTACFIPTKAQLIFLVHGGNGKYELYLGLRSYNCVSGENVNHVRTDITKKYDFIDSLTGIPSMESQYKTVYPATIDTLLAGMQKKDFTYMVIADPVPETEIDGILYKVRDYNGQAESLKSFNFSENASQSMSVALSESKAVCDSISDTVGESKTKKSKWGMLGAGITLASFIFLMTRASPSVTPAEHGTPVSVSASFILLYDFTLAMLLSNSLSSNISLV